MRQTLHRNPHCSLLPQVAPTAWKLMMYFVYSLCHYLATVGFPVQSKEIAAPAWSLARHLAHISSGRIIRWPPKLPYIASLGVQNGSSWDLCRVLLCFSVLDSTVEWSISHFFFFQNVVLFFMFKENYFGSWYSIGIVYGFWCLSSIWWIVLLNLSNDIN